MVSIHSGVNLGGAGGAWHPHDFLMPCQDVMLGSAACATMYHKYRIIDYLLYKLRSINAIELLLNIDHNCSLCITGAGQSLKRWYGGISRLPYNMIKRPQLHRTIMESGTALAVPLETLPPGL